MSTQAPAEFSPFEAMPVEFQSIFNSLNEGLILADNDGAIRYVNTRFEQITGYPRDHVLGKRIYEVYFAPGSDESHAYAAEMAERYEQRRSGLSEIYETEIVRSDGARRWIETKAAPLVTADGRIVGSIGALADVTDQKILQEQLRWTQKMEAVGKLAGGVAHDFNNLLTVIQGNAELLHQELPIDTPLRRKVEVIREASEAASLLTQQLLHISRRQVAKMVPIDVSKVIEGSLRVIQGVLGERIELVADLDQHLPTVLGDFSQLQQILLNFVTNARDAMPDGGTLLIETSTVDHDWSEIETDQATLDDCFVRVRVRDTGVGMSDSVKAKIFEPFYSTKGHGSGTGLGLTVTAGIIEQHGASLTVKSSPGQGTTFDVFFPVHSLSAGGATDDLLLSSLRGNEVILVVEDNMAVRALLTETLDRFGYTVLQAKDGQRALELVRSLTRTSIDLVITDLVMPGMSGSQLAEEIQTITPSVKVLLMSGYADDPHFLVSEQTQPFLPKPFTPDALLRAVRGVLDAPEGKPFQMKRAV